MIRRATSSLVVMLLASPLVLVGCTVTVHDANAGGTSSISGTGGSLVTGGVSSTVAGTGGTGAPSGGSSVTGTNSVTVGGSSAVSTSSATTGGAAAIGGASATSAVTTAGESGLGGSTNVLVAMGGASTAGGTSAATPAAGTNSVGGASAAIATGGASGVAQSGGSSSVATGGTSAVTTTTAAGCLESPKFSGGDVTADRTLTAACSPYLITDDIYIDGNATLTIEPGVTLKFDAGTMLRMGYSGAAKLSAVGTAANPITFTSAVSSPSAGDWKGLELWNGTMGGTTLAYASVQYCGESGGACISGTSVKPGRVTIDHVTIDNVGAGANGIEENNDANFTITSCTFKNISNAPTQQYAISVPAPSFAGIDSTNMFDANAMIELAGGTVSATTTWKNTATVVAVTSTLYLDGTPAPILTIPAGSVYEFADDTQLRIGYNDGGNLIVAGTATAPVTFTSLDASPAPGSWQGINVWDKATLAYATVSYAGATEGNVFASADTTVLEIRNSILSNSLTYGIGVPCKSLATVTNQNNTFTDNVDGDVGPGPAGAPCN